LIIKICVLRLDRTHAIIMIDTKENTHQPEEELSKLPAIETADEQEDDSWDGQPVRTSLNEELAEKIKDDPNKFIGCGG